MPLLTVVDSRLGQQSAFLRRCNQTLLKAPPDAEDCADCTQNFLIVLVTPIMIAHIHWGTYLFFFAVNVCFLPIIYFFYPETRQRSLEEIDIIFAKGHSEKVGYVRAAKELPFLDNDEVEKMAIDYGLIEAEQAGRRGSVASGAEFTADAEKEKDSSSGEGV